MKAIFNFILWSCSIGVIIGAYLTQIPFLVTIILVAIIGLVVWGVSTIDEDMEGY